jgi:hypothetical protein
MFGELFRKQQLLIYSANYALEHHSAYSGLQLTPPMLRTSLLVYEHLPALATFVSELSTGR